ncbi:response regulator [Candidatus Woesearchaeota archaeon]|nr:response regulator [Candidatus Woesearchaeota archaeon]
MSKILSIENGNLTQKVIDVSFKMIGYEVIRSDGEGDVLELFKQNQKDISLVLCDYILPKENGITIISRIKKINSSVPCFLMTGLFNDPQIPIDSYEKGVDLVIYKPFRFEYLQQNFIKYLTDK